MTEAREAFEKWYASNFVEKFVNIGAQLEKRGGQYIDFHAQDMWQVWQEQQKKIDELQKRVDAVKTLIEEYRDPPTEGKTFSHALSIVADELEQALKGGEA